MSARTRQTGPRALDLVEEAVGLLRLEPAWTLSIYYAGAIPFVLAGLFFWSDMSRAAGALDRLVGGALLVAVLYLGMKVSQLAFARRLRSLLTSTPTERWSVGQWLGAARWQVLVQPWRLVVLPLAGFMILPWPWALAFFENLTVIGSEGVMSRRELVRRAWRQAILWPGQNRDLSFLLLLFGFVVWVNVVLMMVLAPQLLNSLFGIETVFVHSPQAYLNSTFLAMSVALTVLAVDPLVKAVYLLRCFHGESRRTGADLRAGFARLRPQPSQQRVPLALFLGFSLFTAAAAESGGGASPEELERAITRVMRRPLYEWRFPREAEEQALESASFLRRWFEEWFGDLNVLVRDLQGGVGRWVQRVGDMLESIGRRVFGRGWRPPVPGVKLDVAGGFQLLLWLALTLALAWMLVWLLRTWFTRRDSPTEALGPAADLSGSWEAAAAAERPADEWSRLAEELLGRGERRLALRAYYLGALAGLARSGWVHLARFKSNREYEDELRRRLRDRPEIVAAFGRLRLSVEPVWYGNHEASAARLEQARSSLGELLIR